MSEKLLVHLSTKNTSVYSLAGVTLKVLYEERVDFKKGSVTDALQKRLDCILDKLRIHVGTLDNEHVRLYATGLFQQLSPTDQTQIIIHTYVEYGLYFNIISPELEQFYFESCGNHVFDSQNMMKGLVHQEFRKVVICGSFQQHLHEIGEVMDVMQKRNIEVLSPWTTNLVPETVGTDFVLLEGQEPLKNKRDAWTHKYIHMNKFRHSDAIIVCIPDGHIGQGTMFEFGFMIALSKRVIFTERPKDLAIPFPYEVGLNFN